MPQTNIEEAATVDRALVEAWQRTLPSTIGEGDRSEVRDDPSDPNALRITINTAGHTGYSFDFLCRYLDKREVQVELTDVEKDGRHVDERTDVIQTLADDYVRHIHECTQVLHELTNR